MSGLWAVAVPTFLGVIGYLYKVWAERVKSRKLVLFYLLEIHYVLKTLPLKTDGLAKQYVAHCEGLFEKAGLSITDESVSSINRFVPSIQDYFDELGSALRTTLDQKFEVAFEGALESLAKDHPVLAYRLKGRMCLEKMAHAVKSYSVVLNSMPEATENELIGDVVKEQIELSVGKAFSEILDEITSDIKKVSRGCGVLTAWRCHKIINKKIELEDDFSSHGLEEEFDSYMKKIIEGAQNKINSKKCSTSRI